MEYVEIKLILPNSVDENTKGIYISDLADLGCDSFSQEKNFIMGYITSVDYAKSIKEISCYIESIPHCTNEIKIIADQNWNELWESNFTTITINDRCTVRAPFHEKVGSEIEIIIMPRMAFGTGHHQTTQLMVDEILNMNLIGKSGLDMGCGTGILAITALIRGASYLDAIDVDEWAYGNVMENAKHNSVEPKISAYWGDAALLEGDGILSTQLYDFIFANINCNILLRDMSIYVDRLKTDGEILFSGFLDSDVERMKNRATELGLEFIELFSRDKWYMLKFSKKNK